MKKLINKDVITEKNIKIKTYTFENWSSFWLSVICSANIIVAHSMHWDLKFAAGLVARIWYNNKSRNIYQWKYLNKGREITWGLCWRLKIFPFISLDILFYILKCIYICMYIYMLYYMCMYVIFWSDVSFIVTVIHFNSSFAVALIRHEKEFNFYPTRKHTSTELSFVGVITARGDTFNSINTI